MLKLQRRKKSSEIAILFREREPFFNQLLWKSLLIALFIHLGAILLFNVRPFIIQTDFIYPPIQVKSDRPSTSLAQVLEEDLDKDIYPLAPPLELLIDLYSPQNEWPHPLISDLQRENYSLYKAPPLKENMMIHPIRLYVSGDLAERQLLKKDPLFDQWVPFDSAKLEPLFVTYQVRLEELTGKIFWHERINSSGDRQLDQQTEKILLNLEFETGAPFQKNNGTVDFHLF